MYTSGEVHVQIDDVLILIKRLMFDGCSPGIYLYIDIDAALPYIYILILQCRSIYQALWIAQVFGPSTYLCQAPISAKHNSHGCEEQVENRGEQGSRGRQQGSYGEEPNSWGLGADSQEESIRGRKLAGCSQKPR